MGQIKNIKLHIITDIKLSSVLNRSREISNGQVEEPHRTQPKCEESSQWYQETTTEQIPFTERSRSKVLEEPAICQETQQERQEVDGQGGHGVHCVQKYHLMLYIICYRKAIFKKKAI